MCCILHQYHIRGNKRPQGTRDIRACRDMSSYPDSAPWSSKEPHVGNVRHSMRTNPLIMKAGIGKVLEGRHTPTLHCLDCPRSSMA